LEKPFGRVLFLPKMMPFLRQLHRQMKIELETSSISLKQAEIPEISLISSHAQENAPQSSLSAPSWYGGYFSFAKA
jgi:hypothetical protein